MLNSLAAGSAAVDAIAPTIRDRPISRPKGGDVWVLTFRSWQLSREPVSFSVFPIQRTRALEERYLPNPRQRASENSTEYQQRSSAYLFSCQAAWNSAEEQLRTFVWVFIKFNPRPCHVVYRLQTFAQVPTVQGQEARRIRPVSLALTHDLAANTSRTYFPEELPGITTYSRCEINIELYPD
ncbi:hypothetical protein Tco_1218137 [Tanacetum coccineum]